jgi:hypothetical protein
MLAIARSSVSCGTVIHEYLMLGSIAFTVVDVVEVIRAGWPALRSNALGLRHFGNSAARLRRRIPRTGSALRSYHALRRRR